MTLVTFYLLRPRHANTANPSARLYIYTTTRDREVTLTPGNSELVDQYRVRLISADIDQQEADVEIRLASFASVQRSLGVQAPGYGQQGYPGPGVQGQLGAPGGYGTTPGTGTGTGTGTQQQQYRRPTLRVDRDTNSRCVGLGYQ